METIRRAGISVLLLAVYALLVTPLGLFARLVRDPLRRRLEPDAPSYWTYDGGGAKRPMAGRRSA